jgi:UDP-glucose 4-epimerase
MKKQKLLITGGCGFIGTSLIEKLKFKYPHAYIMVLDNLTTGTERDLAEVCDFNQSGNNDSVKLINGDIRHYETCLAASTDCDAIVHLAANTGVGPSVDNPRLDMETNVVGTFNMLEAARINNVNKFIFASSGAPAGEVEPPIHEEVPPHPVSPYGSSKLAGEGYCSSYYRTFGINTICLRFGNVYGPRSKHKASVVAKFIKQALAQEPCVIYGDGSQTRDFIYIEDLVNAIILGLEKEIGGETFQIATGHESTVGEVAIQISECLQSRNIPMDIQFDSPRTGDVMRNYSDTTKAREVLGWQPQVQLIDGIEKTIAYFTGLDHTNG